MFITLASSEHLFINWFLRPCVHGSTLNSFEHVMNALNTHIYMHLAAMNIKFPINLRPQWNMLIIGSSCWVRRLYGTHVGGRGINSCISGTGVGWGPNQNLRWYSSCHNGRTDEFDRFTWGGRRNVLADFRFRANLLPVWEFPAKVKSINRRKGREGGETWSRQLISRHAWSNKLAAVR